MTIETEISARLRATVAKLRTTPMPLADLIPLLQQAADEADRFYNGMENWKNNAQAKDKSIAELNTQRKAAVNFLGAYDALSDDDHIGCSGPHHEARDQLAAQPAAPVAVPEPAGWRDFLVRLVDLEGSMVNGNRLSRAAKELLEAHPLTTTPVDAQKTDDVDDKTARLLAALKAKPSDA